MIRAVNKHIEPGVVGEYDGRPSILGNPFVLGRDGTREEVVEKYRRWLWGQIQQGGEVYQELLELKHKATKGDLTLLCWCTPKLCHADVLKAAVEWLMSEDGRFATESLAKNFKGL